FRKVHKAKQEIEALFGRVTTPAFPSEVPTPGRWTGQAALRPVAIRPRLRRLAGLSSSNPIRWRPPRRPRTEARPRRKANSQLQRGIDKPRPVTEGRNRLIAPL